MAVQYTNWVYAPFPTQIDTSSPVVSFVSPPTPAEGARISSREVIYQWTADKANCVFKYKKSWETDWSSWGAATTTTSDNLPNGNYSIAVQARDLFGNESAVNTRSFVVYRELPVPVPIMPSNDSILDDSNIAFVCNVPRGENGQTWHFEFQIATNELMTEFVDNTTWFSSVNGYESFSYTSPVPENTGGNISFNKVLTPRKKYWWRCRVRLAGTNLVSAASEAKMFTVGVLGTQLVVNNNPNEIRADGVKEISLTAEVQDALGRIDTAWTGNVTFTVVNGVANFTAPNTNIALTNGIASTSLSSSVINAVEIHATSALLPTGVVTVNFIANRLPENPEWADSTINPSTVVGTVATLTCSIPADADNDLLHFMIVIDTEDSFDSPNLFVAESRFDTVGWEYFDGTNWLAFPAAGVPQGSGLVRYTTIEPLQDTTKYYARICAWDNYEV